MEYSVHDLVVPHWRPAPTKNKQAPGPPITTPSTSVARDSPILNPIHHYHKTRNIPAPTPTQAPPPAPFGLSPLLTQAPGNIDLGTNQTPYNSTLYSIAQYRMIPILTTQTQSKHGNTQLKMLGPDKTHGTEEPFEEFEEF